MQKVHRSYYSNYRYIFYMLLLLFVSSKNTFGHIIQFSVTDAYFTSFHRQLKYKYTHVVRVVVYLFMQNWSGFYNFLCEYLYMCVVIEFFNIHKIVFSRCFCSIFLLTSIHPTYMTNELLYYILVIEYKIMCLRFDKFIGERWNCVCNFFYKIT